jgi:hypothetical protein
MSLKQQIDHANLTLFRLQESARNMKELIAELEATRKDCEHVFSDAVKGFEHEGGQCSQCGINELYAISQKIGA